VEKKGTLHCAVFNTRAAVFGHLTIRADKRSGRLENTGERALKSVVLQPHEPRSYLFCLRLMLTDLHAGTTPLACWCLDWTINNRRRCVCWRLVSCTQHGTPLWSSALSPRCSCAPADIAQTRSAIRVAAFGPWPLVFICALGRKLMLWIWSAGCWYITVGVALAGSGLIHQRHRQRLSGGLETTACSHGIVVQPAAAWFMEFVAMGASEHPSLLLRAPRVVLSSQHSTADANVQYREFVASDRIKSPVHRH
jgi:hypothetical protein